jgi:integrase
MSTAKSRLYRRLEAGKREYQGEHHGKIVTLGDWAREWLRRELKRPNIKPGTKNDNDKKVKSICEAPVMSVAFSKLNQEQCLEWWRELNERVAPVTANARFRVFRAIILLAMEETRRIDNPIKKLKRKPVRRRVRNIPDANAIRELAQTIREQGKRHSLECAAMVEFAAYSGARPAEVAAIRAEDIDGDWLVI